MQANSIIGLMGLALIVALAATAFQNGSNVATILNAATSGFSNVVRAATLQPTV